MKTDVFSETQYKAVRYELAQLAHVLGARKLEEGDWKRVYCGVKNIPESGWSNLPFADILYNGLGVEHKLMGSDVKPVSFCGTSRMHPAATRSIRIDSTRSAESQKRAVLTQYGDLIKRFKRRVAESSPTGEADLRTGWLFYHRRYAQFMYFEEELRPPTPGNYAARWVTITRQRGRKSSKNLWIFERGRGGTYGPKRFSITTVAGAKIQPYVDVPPAGTEGLYLFDISDAEVLVDGHPAVGIWVTGESYRAADQAARRLGFDSIDRLLENIDPGQVSREDVRIEPSVEEHLISSSAYRSLRSIRGKNDEERLRRVLSLLTHSDIRGQTTG